MRIYLGLIFCSSLISCTSVVEDEVVIQSAESVYKAPEPSVYAHVHAHGDHWHSHHTRCKHTHPNHQWDLVEEEVVMNEE
jgi:hypothetical protein